MCADVGTLVYHLRLNGDRISSTLLAKHDFALRASLDSILGGGVTSEAWELATLGVTASGLGLKEADAIALPAFVASRLASRPHVQALAAHMEEAEIGTVKQIMEKYDSRTTAALLKVVSLLDSEAGEKLVEDLEDATAKTEDQWRTLFTDADEGALQPCSLAPDTPKRPGSGHTVLPDDEDEDEAHPEHTVGGNSLHIQKCITKYFDAKAPLELKTSYKDRGDFSGFKRIEELSHPDQDHSWMWMLSKNKGPTLSAQDYVEAVRIRLGIAGPAEAVPCRLCGEIGSDGSAAHAFCCARAESTRGHTGATHQLAEEIATIDSLMEIEPAGLSAGTSLRPADVLTSVLGGNLTAIDIGIASPDAVNASDDYVSQMRTRKLEKYSAYSDELEAQNITYRPMPISCYGLFHPDSLAILRTLSHRIARRRGCSASEWRFRRMRAKLTVQVWKRAARMVRACWPDIDEEAEPGYGEGEAGGADAAVPSTFY